MDEYLKRCPQCGETKSRDLFNRNRAQADGLQTRCPMCEHGIDQKTCADCELPVTGYAKRCREHQAEADARKLAQAEHGRQLREAAAASRAAEDERKRTRRCAECDGHIDVTKPRHARYCGKECRDAVNKRKQQADYLAARTVIERSCADCRTDLTERATSHPGATRCESCQAKHRSDRKRNRKSRAVERNCTGCGKSLKKYAKGKTMCGYCEQGPRWCIGCGDVDLRGKLGLRCEDCRAAWLEGKKARSLADVLRWQHDNPEATMLIRARSRAKRREVECTITVDDIVIPDLCPVTGVELTRNLGELHSSPDSPSIDRIDNTRATCPATST